MTARFSAFPQDHSNRWVLVPGVASTRQFQIRNDSDAPVECHLSVDEPAAASVSPTILTIPARHSRTVDIIFLADWLPAQNRRVVVSLCDAQRNSLAQFSHEIVAADGSDCGVALDWKDEVSLNGALAGFKLWCSITSRSSTPRRFEIEFTPHPALRFPERKTVTLAPGESSAFEVPVEWNRSVRDIQGRNHPRVIEVSVPVTDGRRAAAMLWDSIEKRLARYLTGEDREQKVLPIEPMQPQRPSVVHKTAGQLKYAELVELKNLERGVVGAPKIRNTVAPSSGTQRSEGSPKRMPVAPLATTGIALVALAVAAFFYLRPPQPQPVGAPRQVTPLRLSLPSTARVAEPPTQLVAHAAAKIQASRAVENATGGPAAAALASKEVSTQRTLPSNSIAQAPGPQPLPAADRDAVVALKGVDANYAAGGRAVNVGWRGAAQAGATVELLNDRGKVIASRVVRGSRSDAVVRLPRGYHGPVHVEVIAIGYHGERVVQSALLVSGG